MTIRFVTVIVVSLQLGCSPGDITSLRDLGVEDWAALQTRLSPAVPKTLENGKSVYDYILDSSTAKTIHQRGTRSLWLAMCQSGDPYVSLLGYRCIVENSPGDSFEAALATMASRGGNSLYFFPEPLQQVNEAKPTDQNKNTFTRFVNNPQNGRLALDDVTAFLDETFLYDWAVSTDLSSVPVPVQYLAVGQVYGTTNEEDPQIPESVAVVFNSFEQQSGNRLATFVWYAPANVGNDRMRTAIERLLQDDTVSVGMYQLALHQRVDFIKQHVDPTKLSLSPRQKERFDHFLESVEKHKRA